MAGLWPDLLKMFSAIPAAGDAVDRNTLALAVYRMAERVLGGLKRSAAGTSWRCRAKRGSDPAGGP
jgi:hypothetical protein